MERMEKHCYGDMQNEVFPKGKDLPIETKDNFKASDMAMMHS